MTAESVLDDDLSAVTKPSQRKQISSSCGQALFAHRDYIFAKRNRENLVGTRSRQKFYFFRFGFFGSDFFADFDDAGGGVPSIRRKPSSNVSPLFFMASGLGMR
jgi:hypothetical protein